jgi:hypothetical protein
MHGRHGDGIDNSAGRYVEILSGISELQLIGCEQYSPYLHNYATTLSTVSFAKFDGSTDLAVELLKKTWNVATGQEAWS